MQTVWGVVVVVLSALCWGGQTIAWFAPDTAVKLGLSEAEADVEPTYHADIRGEALWDVLTLWTLVVAGILLIVDNAAWAYFGLVGGGMYVYFAGRAVFTRSTMLRGGFRVGTRLNLRVNFTFAVVWGLMGLITIVASVGALPTE